MVVGIIVGVGISYGVSVNVRVGLFEGGSESVVVFGGLNINSSCYINMHSSI